MSEEAKVFIVGQLGTVRTLADGGVRVTLELPVGSLSKLVGLGLDQHGAICAICAINPGGGSQERDETPQSKDSKEQTNGQAYRRLFETGFFYAPAVKQAVARIVLDRMEGVQVAIPDTAGMTDKEAAKTINDWSRDRLHKMYGVDSLSNVPTDVFVSWCVSMKIDRFLPREWREFGGLARSTKDQ